MNKSTFFSGQPIFTQLLKFIPKSTVATIARDSKADRYSKRFSTYEHLITMLYSIFNRAKLGYIKPIDLSYFKTVSEDVDLIYLEKSEIA